MSIRDLGFVRWKDPYAKYETKDSVAFKEGIKEEQTIYNKAISDLDPKNVERWTTEFQALPKTYDILFSFSWLHYDIDVRPDNRYIPTLEIHIKNKNKKTFANIIEYGTTKNRLWLIYDSSNGKEQLSLFIYDENLSLVKEIENVGDTAVSNDDEIYFLSADHTFWFNKLYKITNSLETTQIYVEKEAKYILYLSSPKYQNTVFLLRKSAIYQDVGYIKINKIIWLEKGYGTKIPLKSETIAYNDFFVSSGKKINYPKHRYLEKAFYIKDNLYFIFTNDTHNSLYLYEDGWTTVLEPTICDIKLLSEIDSVLISSPDSPSKVFKIHNKTTLHLVKILDGENFHMENGLEPVPWYSVSKTTESNGLIVNGYGSYGLSLRKNQQRIWIPWIKQGYTVAFVGIRGGRENGDSWWDESRTSSRRINGVMDFVKSVKHLQKKLGFSSNQTIIFGRSAGGFLVTAASAYLINDVKVIYAAKPYTDVLRTTSNIKASQTLQETDEFGLATNPVDFSEIIKI